MPLKYAMTTQALGGGDLTDLPPNVRRPPFRRPGPGDRIAGTNLGYYATITQGGGGGGYRSYGGFGDEPFIMQDDMIVGPVR